MEALLRIQALHKRYTVPVLTDVSLELRGGEVLALVGANGAGKSTLSRIIAGLTQPNKGAMRLGGEPYAPSAKSEAEHAGVHMVMQELKLVGTLNVAENIYLNRMPRRFGLVKYREMYRKAHQALAEVGLSDIDPRTPVRDLGVGHQQLVEIAATLSRSCRLLILDEPTAALTTSEIDVLFERVAVLKKQGVGIIYISHRMAEIRQIADRVMVLRDGNVVGAQPVEEVSTDEIVQMMVGRKVVEMVDLGTRQMGEPALRVEGLCRGKRVRNVSFAVREGEILGFAGLVGAGRTETLRAIFGADQPEAGRVMVGPEETPVSISHPRDAVRVGIGMVPEDRKQQGLLLSQPVRINETLAALGNVVKSRGWIDPAKERKAARELSAAMEVQSTSIEQPAVELSGGNQQKVVIARWLMRDCKVLLFDEPTRGIDVGAKQTVYRLLGRLSRQGKAIVMVSSELRELMALCDRIAVMSAGKITTTFARGEWTEDRIMGAAVSGYAGTPISSKRA